MGGVTSGELSRVAFISSDQIRYLQIWNFTCNCGRKHTAHFTQLWMGRGNTHTV